MLHYITKEQYLTDPCRSSSLAYWKTISYPVPDGLKVVHVDDFVHKDECLDMKKYFRLIHNLEHIKLFSHVDYLVRTVEIEKEKELVAHILSVCYHADFDIKFVDNLMQTKVYDPHLWVIAIEKSTMMPVGLGIADFDPEIKEGSLEWIQVMPEKRGLGIGTLLVGELLQRLKAKADFVTTSGQTSNKSNPEGLYRKCGFQGDDVWYVIRKILR